MARDIQITVSPTALTKIQRLIATGLLLVFWSIFVLALIASSVMALLVVPTFMQSMTSFGATPPALLADAGLASPSSARYPEQAWWWRWFSRCCHANASPGGRSWPRSPVWA